VTLDDGGSFNATAPELEALFWSGGRLVIRVEQGSRCAEGFLSITAAAEIIRRAGRALPRASWPCFAGTETPADVAAILSWFREEPRRLDVAGPSMGRSAENSKDRAPVFVPIGPMKARQMESARQIVLVNRRGAERCRWSYRRLRFVEARGTLARTLRPRPTRDDDETPAERAAASGPCGGSQT